MEYFFVIFDGISFSERSELESDLLDVCDDEAGEGVEVDDDDNYVYERL